MSRPRICDLFFTTFPYIRPRFGSGIQFVDDEGYRCVSTRVTISGMIVVDGVLTNPTTHTSWLQYSRLSPEGHRLHVSDRSANLVGCPYEVAISSMRDIFRLENATNADPIQPTP